MNDITQKWLDYRIHVVPIDAPSIQVIESKRAYFAGAQAIVAMLTHLGNLPVQQQKNAVSDLEQEINRFRADVAAGRA